VAALSDWAVSRRIRRRGGSRRFAVVPTP
jgi:hypothetical protein